MIDTANIHEHAVYPSIKKATALGLITSDFDPDSPHRARKLELTDKGKFIAKRLDEINQAISKWSCCPNSSIFVFIKQIDRLAPARRMGACAAIL